MAANVFSLRGEILVPAEVKTVLSILILFTFASSEPFTG
jgi:hypothetical protein